METIYLKGTTKTPEVTFNPVTCHLLIKGRSIPENSFEFFDKIQIMVDRFVKESATIELQLDYFNSSSSKNILKLLKNSSESIPNLQIIWHTEEDDSDMVEFVEDLEKILNKKIKLIKN